MFSKITTLATIIAVVNAGNTIIRNHCPSKVYMSLARGDGSVAPEIVLEPFHHDIQPYQAVSSGGISMKLGFSPGAPSITQFEYTVGDGTLWYDISNINGYPFMEYGLDLIPGDSSCPAKQCPAGVAQCVDAYNVPDDNEATAACGLDQDLTLVLCATRHLFKDAGSQDGTVNGKLVAKDAAPSPVAEAAPVTTLIKKVRAAAPEPVAAPEPTAVAMHEEVHAAHKRAAHRHHFQRGMVDSN